MGKVSKWTVATRTIGCGYSTASPTGVSCVCTDLSGHSNCQGCGAHLVLDRHLLLISNHLNN